MKGIAVFAIALLCVLPAFAGNGAQSGPHYTLNIIGMETCKTQDLTGSNRHTIFVDLDYQDATPTSPTPVTSLNRKNKIFLSEGPFQVLDGNACDGAEFQLPAPGCDTLTVEDVSGCDYDVYVRGLGKPGGEAWITTCAIDEATTDPTDDYYQCSTDDPVHVDRTKAGKSTFQNVTKELLTMCVDTFTDGVYDGNCDVRLELFQDPFETYFWDYDNNGLRLAQLRFYPVAP